MNKTTAIENVPKTQGEVFDWLINLDRQMLEKKLAFDEACRAVAEKYDIKVGDLKAGVKARRDLEKGAQMVQKQKDKAEIMQEIMDA